MVVPGSGVYPSIPAEQRGGSPGVWAGGVRQSTRGTQSLTVHEMTREKISSLWFEGERPGWDLRFAASRRHREVFAGLQHTPSPAPSRQPACAFICMQSRGVPAHLHMQDVGAQSWKKKLSPKASDFQKK